MTERSTMPPAPPVLLNRLEVGDALVYPADGIEFHFDVLEVDPRNLPMVEVSAAVLPGSDRTPIIDRINSEGFRGVILGTWIFGEEGDEEAWDGTLIKPGEIHLDIPESVIALEMYDNGDYQEAVADEPDQLPPDSRGWFVGSFPLPTTRPIIRKGSQ